MIYGRTLHTIAFINGLLNRGVEGNRIHYVIPPRTYIKKTVFGSNQERAEYEDLKISDPDGFEDEGIEQKIFEILKEKEISIYKDYSIQEIIVDQKNITQGIIIKDAVPKKKWKCSLLNNRILLLPDLQKKLTQLKKMNI